MLGYQVTDGTIPSLLYLQVPKEGQEYGGEDSPGRRRRELNLEEELDLTSMQLVNALIAEKKTKAKVGSGQACVVGNTAMAFAVLGNMTGQKGCT
jgi:hypothetical protein